MKNLTMWMRCNAVLAAVFTLLTISFHGDISLAAFPLSLVFTAVIAYLTLVVLLQKQNIKKLGSIIRLLQYEPFVFIAVFVIRRAGTAGMPFALDVVAVLLWIAITVVSFIILFYLNPKRIAAVSQEWASYCEAQKKPEFKDLNSSLKRICIEVLEWIDALVQAVFTIILFNIFLFQLYEIPSESMVPTFLIKDRVTVFKTLAGPKFPLSNVGLPYLQNYDRGDIIVFRNPHYSDDRKSEVKTFMSQFLYMLTLTLVKTNTDENGELKADPLVKRITGLPGEQLMMMDGTLYARTSDDSDFKAVAADSTWAAWNLNALDPATKSKVQWIPLSSAEAENTLLVEAERRTLDLSLAKSECETLAKRFDELVQESEDSASKHTSFSDEEMLVYSFLNRTRETAISLLGNADGTLWFDSFMNDWHRDLPDGVASYTEDGAVNGSHLVGGNLYDDANFRLNVMVKLVAGNLIVRQAELNHDGVSVLEWRDDVIVADYMQKAERLTNYIIHMDQRNMSVFPPNDASGNPVYIPADCYFMMGDNRYNSLDMRHSYEPYICELTPYDKHSVLCYSRLKPQYVSKKKILGKAGLRFWPLSRLGMVK